MIYLRISAMLGALLAVFLLGMWLTWPELFYNPTGFPINRNFVAVSLNGEPLANAELPRAQTLQARRESMFRLRAFGYGGCNGWIATLMVMPPKSVVWVSSTGPWWRADAPACTRSAIWRLCSARRDGVGRSAR